MPIVISNDPVAAGAGWAQNAGNFRTSQIMAEEQRRQQEMAMRQQQAEAQERQRQFENSLHQQSLNQRVNYQDSSLGLRRDQIDTNAQVARERMGKEIQTIAMRIAAGTATMAEKQKQQVLIEQIKHFNRSDEEVQRQGGRVELKGMDLENRDKWKEQDMEFKRATLDEKKARRAAMDAIHSKKDEAAARSRIETDEAKRAQGEVDAAREVYVIASTSLSEMQRRRRNLDQSLQDKLKLAEAQDNADYGSFPQGSPEWKNAFQGARSKKVLVEHQKLVEDWENDRKALADEQKEAAAKLKAAIARPPATAPQQQGPPAPVQQKHWQDNMMGPGDQGPPQQQGPPPIAVQFAEEAKRMLPGAPAEEIRQLARQMALQAGYDF